MKFLLKHASDFGDGSKQTIREIESLDELLNLLSEFECDLIISNRFVYHDEAKFSITIYDDYIE